jgi:hypothetical protein
MYSDLLVSQTGLPLHPNRSTVKHKKGCSITVRSHTASNSFFLNSPVRLSRPCSTRSGFLNTFPLISSSNPIILSPRPYYYRAYELVSKARGVGNSPVLDDMRDRVRRLLRAFAAGDLCRRMYLEMERRWKIQLTFGAGCLRPLQTNVR